VPRRRGSVSRDEMNQHRLWIDLAYARGPRRGWWDERRDAKAPDDLPGARQLVYESGRPEAVPPGRMGCLTPSRAHQPHGFEPAHGHHGRSRSEPLVRREPGRSSWSDRAGLTVPPPRPPTHRFSRAGGPGAGPRSEPACVDGFLICILEHISIEKTVLLEISGQCLVKQSFREDRRKRR
jgi:hypothetical protein